MGTKESDAAFDPTKEAMITKLAVKHPMKAVKLHSRRTAKQLLDTPKQDTMLVAEPHTSKLLAEAEGVKPVKTTHKAAAAPTTAHASSHTAKVSSTSAKSAGGVPRVSSSMRARTFGS